MKNIKSLSIRARVAYGILCLENTLEKCALLKSDWQVILDKFWLFTQLEYVDEWLYIISPIMPDSILGDPHDEESSMTLTEYQHLKRVYDDAPLFIFEIMECIFNCGRRHFYGAVTPQSPETFEYIKLLQKIMRQEKVAFPNADGLKKYPFDKHQGWGDTFGKKDLF
jgi:hypothetical protein